MRYEQKKKIGIFHCYCLCLSVGIHYIWFRGKQAFFNPWQQDHRQQGRRFFGVWRFGRLWVQYDPFKHYFVFRFFKKRGLIFKTVCAVLWPITFGCCFYAGVFMYVPYGIYNIVMLLKKESPSC